METELFPTRQISTLNTPIRAGQSALVRLSNHNPANRRSHQPSLPQGSSIEQSMQAEGLLALPNQSGRYRITCLAGLLWITQSDDSVDHTRRAGESFETLANRMVVIQALQDSQVRVDWME